MSGSVWRVEGRWHSELVFELEVLPLELGEPLLVPVFVPGVKKLQYILAWADFIFIYRTRKPIEVVITGREPKLENRLKVGRNLVFLEFGISEITYLGIIS